MKPTATPRGLSDAVLRRGMWHLFVWGGGGTFSHHVRKLLTGLEKV